MSSIRPRLLVAVSAITLVAIAVPAAAQMQTPSQIKCIMAMNDAVSKVAKVQLGVQSKCLKAAAYGTLPMGQDIATCVTADADGKVSATVVKTGSKDVKVCPTGLAGFAYTSPGTATTAGIDAAHLSFDDIMALDAMGSVLSYSTNPDGSKCQASITKGSAKLLLAMLAEFRACKKAGLSDGSITNSVELGNVCFDAVTADASGKIGAASSKLGDVFLKCSEIAQATLIPGVCAGAADATACITNISRCRTCQAFNAADNLVRGCDQFDDGTINGSCETQTTCDDDDGDSYGENCDAGEDCNDINPNINPGEIETCNGLDDDCNDFVDDSPTDDGASCGSSSMAPCMLGTMECINGELECTGEIEPTAELCNGVDDDCDGTADDSPTDVGAPCGSSSTPPCMLGTTECVDTELECVGEVEPVAEMCNLVDDDCNGTADDGATCDPGETCDSGMCVPE